MNCFPGLSAEEIQHINKQTNTYVIAYQETNDDLGKESQPFVGGGGGGNLSSRLRKSSLALKL